MIMKECAEVFGKCLLVSNCFLKYACDMEVSGLEFLLCVVNIASSIILLGIHNSPYLADILTGSTRTTPCWFWNLSPSGLRDWLEFWISQKLETKI